MHSRLQTRVPGSMIAHMGVRLDFNISIRDWHILVLCTDMRCSPYGAHMLPAHHFSLQSFASLPHVIYGILTLDDIPFLTY
ncbi:unnamed protein product [Musa textilis]